MKYSYYQKQYTINQKDYFDKVSNYQLIRSSDHCVYNKYHDVVIMLYTHSLPSIVPNESQVLFEVLSSIVL